MLLFNTNSPTTLGTLFYNTDTLPERPNTGPAAVINLSRESFMRPPQAVQKNEELSNIESVLAEILLIGTDKSGNHRNEENSSHITNSKNHEAVHSSSTNSDCDNSLNLEDFSDRHVQSLSLERGLYKVSLA